MFNGHTCRHDSYAWAAWNPISINSRDRTGITCPVTLIWRSMWSERPMPRPRFAAFQITHEDLIRYRQMGFFSFFFCSQWFSLRHWVHLLLGAGWCGAGQSPLPTLWTCWWSSHPAAMTAVSLAAGDNNPGECGALSILLFRQMELNLTVVRYISNGIKPDCS